MEHRDIIKDEVEQLGRVLGKILLDFIGLKNGGDIADGIKVSNQRLQREADLDIEELLTLKREELIEYLNNKNFTDDHLEILSDYFAEIGTAKYQSNQPATIYIEKAIELLDIIDERSRSLSFDRMNKMDRLRSMLR